MPSLPAERLLLSSFADAANITVHDSTDFARPFHGLYVGSAGDVKLKTLGGTSIVFPGVPAGAILDVVGVRVFSTGTTVSTPNTNILALYKS